MEKQVFLFRHGEPAEGAQHICRGSSLNAELSENGEAQTYENITYLVDRFGEQLRDALVVTSPLARASYLGKEFAKEFGLQHEIDDELTDIRVGDWEGLSWEEIKDRWPLEFEYCWNDARSLVIPNGESVHAFEERVLRRWQHWIATSRAKIMIFCLHKCSNKTILSSIDHRILDFNGQKIGCMNEVRIDERGQATIIQEDAVLYRKASQPVLQQAT